MWLDCLAQEVLIYFFQYMDKRAVSPDSSTQITEKKKKEKKQKSKHRLGLLNCYNEVIYEIHHILNCGSEIK